MGVAFQVLLVALCVWTPATDAHNWLLTPPSRTDNKDSLVAPCPTAPEDYEPVEIIFDADVGSITFEAKWTTEHLGDHIIRVVKKEDEESLEGLTRGNQRLAFYESYDVKTESGVVELLEEGDYVLQYAWGNYRNCVDLKVTKIVSVGDDGTICEANCDLVTGRHSECVGAVCVCEEGYEFENGFCADPLEEITVSCETYCSDSISTCSGSAKIYNSQQSCLGDCAMFPKGRATDISGVNSLYCRWHHLHIEGGDPEVHCPHASLEGGGKCEGDEEFYNAVSMTVYGIVDVTQDQVLNVVRAGMETHGFVSEVGVSITDYSPSSTAGAYTFNIRFEEIIVEDAATDAPVPTDAATDAPVPTDALPTLGKTAAQLKALFQKSSSDVRKSFVEDELIDNVVINTPNQDLAASTQTTLQPFVLLLPALALLFMK